jgi:hypothetical protein
MESKHTPIMDMPVVAKDDGAPDYLDGIQSQFSVCNNSGHVLAYTFDKAITERIVTAVNCHDDLVKALRLTQRMFDEALPKFDWGKSALDANAIQLLNEAPIAVSAAIRKATGEE